MAISDQIADMLTRMRNAVMVRHDVVTLPASSAKLAIVKILKEEGFIRDYEVMKGKPERVLRIHLKYDASKQSFINGMERVSKPGLRIYVQKNEIPRVYGGMGIAIVSTPKGVMTGKKAWRQSMGGELLCYVW